MVLLVNSNTNATSKKWHLWEIDLKFALNSTPGWLEARNLFPGNARVVGRGGLDTIHLPKISSEASTT